MAGKKSAAERAIEVLENEITVRQMAIERIKAAQKPKESRKPRAVAPTEKAS